VIVSDASDAARRSCVRLGAFGGWTAAALAPPGRRGVGSGTAAFGFVGTLGCGSCMMAAWLRAVLRESRKRCSVIELHSILPSAVQKMLDWKMS